MKAEQIILSFIAVLIGLLVAGGSFYIYQLTKEVPPEKTTAITIQTPPSPTPELNHYLKINTPKDEEIVNKKIITISGSTLPNSTIIVSSENEDQVVKPTKNGDFSITHTIGDDTNVIYITAIFPNGEEQTEIRTVSFTNEEF